MSSTFYIQPSRRFPRLRTGGRISGLRFSLPPKNNVCEPERQNDFGDVKPFVLILANQIKGENTARVTTSDLARCRVLDFCES